MEIRGQGRGQGELHEEIDYSILYFFNCKSARREVDWGLLSVLMALSGLLWDL